MYYKLNPRVRIFIKQIVWVGGAYLAVTGLLAIIQGHVNGPDWWLILVFLIAAAVGASLREIPFSVKAKDAPTGDK